MKLMFLVWIVETVLPVITAAMCGGLLIAGICLVGWLLCIGEKGGEAACAIFKKTGIWCLCIALFLSLVPRKETAYLMVGAYSVEWIATHEATKRVGARGLALIEKSIDKFDTYLQEPPKVEE